ncbi:hypothetical protein BHM03_00007918 [Ensete ventricosum]|nr:hypothetical protein BHM03_00007918 [Ensete ventricosum]
MLSSSSVIPPQATTDTSSRISSSYSSSSKSGISRIVAFRDPPPDAEEDAIKSDDGGEDENRSGSKISRGESRDTSSDQENQIDSASSRRENENRSGGEEESKGRQELERPQEAEENPNGGNEVNQEQPVRENKKEGEKGNRGGDQRLAGRDLDGATEDGKRLSEEEIHEQEQREHDEQLPSGEGEENQQETQQPQQTGSDSQEEQIHEEQQREHDEQLLSREGEENQREAEQQQQTANDSQEEQTHEEQQREHDEQLPGGEGEQNQQESQQLQQQTEGDSQGNQQGSQPDIDENHDQVEEKIQQVTNENQPQREESVDESQTQSDEKAEEGSNESQQQEETGGGGDDQQQPQSERQMEEEITNDSEQEGNGQHSEEKLNDPNAGESLTERAQSNASKDNGGDRKMPWATQADHSDNEKERRRGENLSEGSVSEGNAGNSLGQEWQLCNVTAGPDYIPCLDNEKAIKQLHSFRHFEHRERHCPEEGPTCLVPLPDGYKRSIEWPKSRDRIWYSNVPRTKLAEVKGHQNWVKITGEYLTFPGGGTQFIHGALHYIDFIQQHLLIWLQSVRDITWGKHSRVVLDVGCGVASLGGYLFERDVLTMSFAPKDEHEAQVQFALERGIPAISAVMGSQRLPFPSMVFDVVHCARCRVPPFWLNSSQMGIYGKPAPDDFTSDYEHWKRVVAKSYLTGFGIRWSNVRNVMDMRAVYGGCKILPLIAEVDRIVRPGGKIIVRDDSVTTSEVESLLKSLHWEVRLTFSKDQEGILCAEKSEWRPEKLTDSA